MLHNISISLIPEIWKKNGANKNVEDKNKTRTADVSQVTLRMMTACVHSYVYLCLCVHMCECMYIYVALVCKQETSHSLIEYR